MKGHIGWNLAAAIGAALAGVAPAATITVNSNGDATADNGACTLREAITAARLRSQRRTTPRSPRRRPIPPATRRSSPHDHLFADTFDVAGCG
jgi:CSLREA domain-containing protein